jgi:hypothetical protein
MNAEEELRILYTLYIFTSHRIEVLLTNRFGISTFSVCVMELGASLGWFELAYMEMETVLELEVDMGFGKRQKHGFWTIS